jgi:hypothetical protein
MSAMVVLPEQLAPALRERVAVLLAQVTQVESVPPLAPLLRQAQPRNRCIVCRHGGVLGGHHAVDGRIEWVHRSCHRRLHRRLDARRRAPSAAW